MLGSFWEGVFLNLFFCSFAQFFILMLFFLTMVPPLHCLRVYFAKNADGKFECNFGCGAKYKESSTKSTKINRQKMAHNVDETIRTTGATFAEHSGVQTRRCN